jgi:hypothetical protein
MNFSFESTYNHFIIYENIKNIEIYNKFLNWIKGEFDLYLMEDLDGLKVYFPNGWFSIMILSERELDLKIVIQIKSKTLNSGIKIETQIKNSYNHLNQVYENKFINVLTQE